MKGMKNLIKPTRYQLYLEKWREGCGSGLCESARNIVHIRGKIPSDLVFVGEAPGDSESVLGVPFCGPAGQLLDKIIAASISTSIRYSLCNLTGCIPRDEDGSKSGEPCEDDIKLCARRLQELLEILNPRLIVTVGALPTKWLDQSRRESIRLHKKIPMVAVKHPAFILKTNQSQQGLLIQRSIVTISQACEEYLNVS